MISGTRAHARAGDIDDKLGLGVDIVARARINKHNHQGVLMGMSV